MRLRWPGALAWRLYAVGIIQLALVIVAAISILILAGRPEPLHFQTVAQRMQQLIGQRQALTKALDEYRARQVELSIYDAQKNLVVSNVQPPLPYPDLGHDHNTWSGSFGDPAADGRETHAHPRRPMHRPLSGTRWPAHFLPPAPGLNPPHPLPRMYAYTALQSNGESHVLVASLAPPTPGALPPVLTLLAGLLVVFAGAMLTARWIASPLEQLSRAARALGHGEFATRIDLKRPDELGDVGRTFNEMAARIQALLLAEKELLANVAHELRTPLARIRVALELASESDAEQARASLSEIALDLSELETLIDDVLTATRFEFESGSEHITKPALALHIEEVPARVVAERALERFAVRHPKRVTTLRSAEGLPGIAVDPVLFRRVLDNLLENAHKYSPDLAQPIELALEASDTALTFEVHDHGSGIAAEDLPRIFSPFFRGERSRSRETGGVGLGLTLAKRIVEAHGGTITLSSQPGVGTSARVTLPLATRVGPSAASASSRQPDSSKS